MTTNVTQTDIHKDALLTIGLQELEVPQPIMVGVLPLWALILIVGFSMVPIGIILCCLLCKKKAPR